MCLATLSILARNNHADMLINHVKASIGNAYNHTSKLIPNVLSLEGMSSSKVRHLLNNLCTLPGAGYLEIGAGPGSTFIAALYKNTNILFEAIAIDNWSEYGYSRDTFIAKTQHHLPYKSFKLYEQDSFKVDIKNLFSKSVDIYFYDGNHTAESHCKAFTYYNSVFSDAFIAVINNWNYDVVRAGTQQAFTELGYTILYGAALPAQCAEDRENWWNGLYVAVIQKK
jgi:hypothetical protein